MKELLLVHSDQSVTILWDKTQWESDPDLYAWREKNEYIVDSDLSILKPNLASKNQSDFSQAWVNSGKKATIKELIELIGKDLTTNERNSMSFSELVEHHLNNEN